MNYRWLVILACLLVTACDSSAPKEETGNKADNGETATTATSEPNNLAGANAESTDGSKDESEHVDPANDKGNAATVLIAEFGAAYDVFMKRIRKAKPNERAEIVKTNPMKEFAEKFRALVEEHPDSEVAATALGWLANNADQPDERESSLATLMEKYPDSLAMKDAATAYTLGKPSQQAEDNLRDIFKNSPHREARGIAAHSLVTYFDRNSMFSKQIDELAKNERFVEQFGEEAIEYLRNMKIEDSEIESLYETIANDYADIVLTRFGTEMNIGDAAKNALFELRNLSMGCVAPNIEGTDLDGKEFALSDYRGKVVMLDFWGDW